MREARPPAILFPSANFRWQSEAISWQSEASENARRRATVHPANCTNNLPVSANRRPAKTAIVIATVIVIAKKGMVPS
jgi:hypothetical protein